MNGNNNSKVGVAVSPEQIPISDVQEDSLDERQKDDACTEDIERLKKELREEQEKSESYMTRLRYLQADFENYQKKIRNNADESARLINERIILGLIDIKEDLDRAISIAKQSDSKEPILDGVEIILTKLDGILRKEGLAEIESIGKQFDPRIHEVVSYIDTNNSEDNLVMSEIRRGYTLHGKVIRTSMVEVARKAKGEKDEHAPKPNKES